MGHQIKNDVYPQWIGDFLGELFEIFAGLAFALPAVADIAIVKCEHGNPLLVIEQGAHAHGFGSRSAWPPLQRWRRGVSRIVIAIPKLAGRHLEPLHRTRYIIDTMKDRMV